MKRHLLVACVVAGLIVAGCGGNGGGSAPLPTQPGTQSGAKTAQATISMFVPTSATSSSARRPEYVSAGTQSVSFQTTLMTSPSVTTLTLGTGNCPAVAGGYDCTASFISPVGEGQTLTVKTYASTDGSGTPLSMNTMAISIIAGTNATVTLTLNGVATSASISLSPGQVSGSGPSVITATINALDASGNVIVGSGTTDAGGNALGTPTSLTSSDSTDFSIGAYSPGPPGNYSITWDLVYFGSDTFTLVWASLPNATATLTYVGPTPSPSASPTPTPSASPTASPSPTPVPAVMTASPSEVDLLGTGASNALSYTIGELGYSGTISVQSTTCNSSIVTFSATSGAGPMLSVTATGVAAGSCTVTYQDTNSQTVVETVTVTTAGIGLQ